MMVEKTLGWLERNLETSLRREKVVVTVCRGGARKPRGAEVQVVIFQASTRRAHRASSPSQLTAEGRPEPRRMRPPDSERIGPFGTEEGRRKGPTRARKKHQKNQLQTRKFLGRAIASIFKVVFAEMWGDVMMMGRGSLEVPRGKHWKGSGFRVRLNAETGASAFGRSSPWR